MSALPYFFVTVSLTCAQVMDDTPDMPDPWARIRVLLKQESAEGDRELALYLKSLTAEEMLTAARQACREVEEHFNDNAKVPAWAAAELRAMLCLRRYFERVAREDGGATLLEIIASPSESPLLRRALISAMWNTEQQFDREFQQYLSAHEPEVMMLLEALLEGRKEHELVRAGVIDCVGERLCTNIDRIVRSDPHYRTLREKSTKVLHPGKLLRTGELALTEETDRALRPLAHRNLAFVKTLGSILAHPDDEDQEVREAAKRQLAQMRRSALVELDEEVDKAWRQGERPKDPASGEGTGKNED